MSDERMQRLREEFFLLPKDARNELLDELCSLQERSGYHASARPQSRGTTQSPARVKTEQRWAKPQRATQQPTASAPEVPLL